MNLKPFIAVVTDIKRFDSVYEKKKQSNEICKDKYCKDCIIEFVQSYCICLAYVPNNILQ